MRTPQEMPGPRPPARSLEEALDRALDLADELDEWPCILAVERAFQSTMNDVVAEYGAAGWGISTGFNKRSPLPALVVKKP